MNQAQMFETLKMPKLIAKMAAPAIIGMLIIVLYNMADTFFVGQTHNDLMITAVSIATPIFMLLITLGTLIGTGGSATISQHLGEKNYTKVKQVSSFCIYAALFSGIAFAVLINLFINPVCRFIGASETSLELTKQYVSIIALSAPVTILCSTMSHIIRSEGSSKESMFGNIVGTVINIILDPIMILSMHLGVKGAAWATLISNLIAAIYYISYFFWKKGSHLSINIKDSKISLSIVKNIFFVGLPIAIANLLSSLSNLILNKFLHQAGDQYLAAMGISLKIMLITTLLQVGLSNGVLPIMAYSRGANNMERFKSCLKHSVIISIVLGTILFLFSYIFRIQLISTFSHNPEIVDIAKLMTSLMLLSAPILGLYNLSIVTMQALKQPRVAMLVSSLRQGLIFVPLIFILSKMFGVMGTMSTQVISDYISVIIALTIVIMTLRKVNSGVSA